MGEYAEDAINRLMFPRLPRHMRLSQLSDEERRKLADDHHAEQRRAAAEAALDELDDEEPDHE